jgi:signal transduction histidine kinase
MSISLHPDTPEGRTLGGSPAATVAPGVGPSGTKIRRRLFTKYVALFVAVVGIALLSNGIFEVFFYYREHKAALIRIQHEQAEAAAAKIGQFVKEIESQLGWTTQLPWSAGSLENRRFDALRLLKQVPAITELAQLDSTGKERLRVSRLAMDALDSGLDLSKDPKFTEAVAHKVYYGPVYFRRESEPYMTIALAGTRKDAGVSIAEVNLKLIWDVVSQIKVGERGRAYVVGAEGRLIAHPDISLVLRNTDMSKLVQVQAALAALAAVESALAAQAEQAALTAQAAQTGQAAPPPQVLPAPPAWTANSGPDALQGALNIQGQEVLTASAPILPLGWIMFVELPVKEAYASLYAALQRLATVLAAALIFAVLAGIFLARRMVGPIQALRAGAERIGGGDFAQRIAIPTGDELEGLANQFNDMGARLQESYAGLENKVEQRTAELTETLQQQTATAEVLKVISRSAFDLQAVLDTLVESAARLCEADMAAITRQKGDAYYRAGSYGFTPQFVDYVKDIPVRPERTTITGRTLLEGKLIHLPDVHADSDYAFSEGQKLSGDPRTFLGVPLLREGNPVGALVLARRAVRPFSKKQIELVTTFADQAVIAIENVRLFDEVQARTTDLQESLQQQTATADVLKVISRSAFDLKSVLTTLTESAQALCGASLGIICLRDGEVMRLQAESGCTQAFIEFMQANPIRPGRDTITGRVFMDGKPVHVPDVQLDPEYDFGRAPMIGDYRAVLAVPLMRDGAVEGVLLLGRPEPGPFSQRQIDLVQTFADQAVIAIENARLFYEVQAKTSELTETLEYQTATGDVLNVISRSPNNLQPVMDTIVHTTRRLCQSEYALMLQRHDDGAYRIAAHSNANQELIDWIRNNPVIAGDGSAVGIVAAEKQTIHLPDALADPRFTDLRRQRQSKARTMLGVPLLRNQTVIGVVFLARTEVRPFSDKQVELVSSFADQAVIAISNVGLFEEVQERTRELSLSLDELRTAQDRLVQTEKLASLGQLTAGIAHEIKNPLNFVNNFSALSAELIDELNEVLKPAALDDKTREEIEELTHMLKGNLEKVVQHGKRADSIVKNMLLHSREGSGEHRPVDINAIVEESLNLAYHGARAERSGFNITLRRDLDPNAGMIDLYPQEITRVFLNLISNGFYAATKRKEAGDETFEPTLSATTKSLGNSVEIRIRDNGTGIPLEVKEKMFNPFFTTKPAGEGTGLGLSMSHDIVVKQHGGKIDVDTMPGVFTEFIITLPRTAAAQAQTGVSN